LPLGHIGAHKGSLMATNPAVNSITPLEMRKEAIRHLNVLIAMINMQLAFR